ncbi:MAG: 1-(5-phosphoribosyl)-5-[Bacteroidaceae bacterium]|nr:1-(5-phosphoribosyl)-5-[(5-phosphoribosylamino)methylideneamino]imidazole-4-carboxamide isomerase [Bacteroidaceae bacterium]MBQ8257761.1 1-(5-phosphoribosyl)-5-[(5-phosphoribosylamino)methylideneamino]imidazole-4-carboxamide isomerase [Bacteroidaceae bacterium]
MMELIPAIDLIDGCCVRLTQGDYADRKVYGQNPVDMAKMYADCGVARLHVVDLDGAKAKEPCNLRVLERLANETSLDIEWGGGIKSSDALRSAIDAGANRVICGSVAVDNSELFASWLQEYGADHIILGADVRGRNVATHGWLKETEVTIDSIIEQFLPFGLKQLICTDISKDGMLQGPNFPLYVELKEKYPMVNTTLSGGISSMADIDKAASLGLHSVIIGKAIYEGRITLNDLKQWLQNA